MFKDHEYLAIVDSTVDAPASYADLKKLGWSTSDYLQYIDFFEQIRALLIIRSNLNESASIDCKYPVCKEHRKNKHIATETVASITADEAFSIPYRVILNNFQNWLDEKLDRTVYKKAPISLDVGSHYNTSYKRSEILYNIGILHWFNRDSFILDGVVPAGLSKAVYNRISPLSHIYQDPEICRFVLEKNIRSYAVFPIDLSGSPKHETEGFKYSTCKAKYRKLRKTIHSSAISFLSETSPIDENLSDIHAWACQTYSHWLRIFTQVCELRDLYDSLIGYADEHDLDFTDDFDYCDDIDFEETSPDFSKYNNILHVYKGFVKCQREKHDIASLTGVIPTTSGSHIPINVSYCRWCDRLFISIEDYQDYKKKFGIIGNIHMMSGHTFPDFTDGALDEESVLKANGYSVSQAAKQSSGERQVILADLMDAGVLTKAEIIKYLTQFMRYNGARPELSDAVSLWNEDLSFVRSYHLSEQPKINIESVKGTADS